MKLLVKKQKEEIARRFKQFCAGDDEIQVDVDPDQVVLRTPTSIVVVLPKHPRVYEALLALAKVFDQPYPGEETVGARDIAALALIMKEELIDLQAKNEKLIEYTLAAIDLTMPHETKEKT